VRKIEPVARKRFEVLWDKSVIVKIFRSTKGFLSKKHYTSALAG
jgi:hypothetical protein